MKPIGDNLIMVARNNRYSDRDFRRLFLWAIDECNPPPPEGLEMVAEFIETDQSALLRRIAEKEAERKEKRKEYAKRQYEKTKAKRANSDISDSSDSSDSSDNTIPTIPTNLPTNQPTSLPTETNVSVRPNGRVNAPACAKPPTIDEVLAWASDGVHKPDGKPIPDEFIRDWYALMEAAEPPWTNTRGRSLVRNWRQEVIYAWRRNQQFARAGGGTRRNANQPDGVVHHEANYENPL